MSSPITMEPWDDVTTAMTDDLTSVMNMTLGEQVRKELNFWIPPVSIVLGLFGNSLCLAATCSSKSILATPTKVYMTVILLMCDIHLTAAVISWLSSSFVDYVNLPQMLFLRTAIVTDLGCQLLAYFRSASLFVLAWLLVAQTGERYAVLSRPFNQNRNPTRIACLVCVIIFFIGFGVEVTKFFGVIASPANDTLPGDKLQCKLNDLGEVAKMVDVLLIFLLSPIFLFVLALCLSCMASLHNSFRKKWRYKRSSFPVNNHKSALPLTMAFVYSLGLLPYFIWSVLFLISLIWGEDSTIDDVALYVEEGSSLLVVLLSGLNLLYLIIAGKRYRALVCRIMCGCFCKYTNDMQSEEDSLRTPSMSNGTNNDYAIGQNHQNQSKMDTSEEVNHGQINMVFEDHDNTHMTPL